MAAIAAVVTVLKNATLKIGATNTYELTVAKAVLNPTTPKTKFKGIGGNQVAQTGTTDWTLDLTFLQDFITANALTGYLLAGAGTTVPFILTPIAGGTAYSGSVLLEPATVGGTVDTELDADVSLTVVGAITSA